MRNNDRKRQKGVEKATEQDTELVAPRDAAPQMSHDTQATLTDSQGVDSQTSQSDGEGGLSQGEDQTSSDGELSEEEGDAVAATTPVIFNSIQFNKCFISVCSVYTFMRYNYIYI